MPTISHITLEFLKDAIRDKVQALFDDPVGYCDGKEFNEHELRAALAELEALAVDAGMNWKILVNEESTEFELERVIRYLGHPIPEAIPEK
jgi:hypothetical protein